MPVLKRELLERLGYEVFKASGIPDAEAEILSSHIVMANLLGHHSHGVWYIPRYGRQALENYVPWSSHQVLKDSPLFQLIDGNRSHGIVALTHGATLAVGKANTLGIGMIGIRNVTHMGRLGAYPTLIADQGMIGMVWTNTGGLAVAPFGSADRKLRLAPVAYAVPRRNSPPFMLDMTFSVVAGGKIEQKIVRGEAIPEGWLVGESGQYITDGSVYHEKMASILPLGGIQFGHKGHGLAMIMEMIVGPLTLAGCTNDQGSGGGGALIIAIDIEKFTDSETFLDQVEEFASYVTSATPLPDHEKIYAPGEIEEEVKSRLEREGIPIPESTWIEIKEIAEQLSVDLPII